MFGMERETGRAEVFIVDDMEINRIVLEEIIREMSSFIALLITLRQPLLLILDSCFLSKAGSQQAH